MSIRDIATVITSILFTLAIVTYAQWNAERAVEQRAEHLEQAAQKGEQWMNDTTAKLDSIQTGIERITGETIELTRQVESLTDRLDRADL